MIQDIENLDDITKEFIYDFMTLISSSIDYISDGYLHIYYDDDDYNISIHYCLRQSLRNIGYKIIEKKSYNNVVVFKTNIPEDVIDLLYTFYEDKCYSVYIDDDIENEISINNDNPEYPEIDNDNQEDY
jgi:hypothetical protein